MSSARDDYSVALTLAIDGGEPVRREPLPQWPSYTEEEIEAAAKVLSSGKVNYWTGTHGRQFEREFADYCGTKYAVAVANGSVALDLALIALDVQPGDEVIVPSRTFIASASCVLLRGAAPVFADVDPVSQTLRIDSVRDSYSSRTKGIIAVHLAGWPCDMDPLLDFAGQHSLWIVEDCAQAHGATYKQQPVGSFGQVGAFSFCQDKIITTAGEGGMVVTNDIDLRNRMWSYKDHGRDHGLSGEANGSGFRWIHTTAGTNYRLTELQAAVGRLQLQHLDDQLRVRREHARRLTEHLARVPGLLITSPPSHVGHAYYKYYAFVEPRDLAPGWDRDRVLTAIRAEGIPCSQGSCSEAYLEDAFPPEIRPHGRLEIARRLGETALMFPVHPTLSHNDILDTCCAVEKVMRAATVCRPIAIAA